MNAEEMHDVVHSARSELVLKLYTLMLYTLSEMLHTQPPAKLGHAVQAHTQLACWMRKRCMILCTMHLHS